MEVAEVVQGRNNSAVGDAMELLAKTTIEEKLVEVRNQKQVSWRCLGAIGRSCCCHGAIGRRCCCHLIMEIESHQAGIMDTSRLSKASGSWKGKNLSFESVVSLRGHL